MLALFALILHDLTFSFQVDLDSKEEVQLIDFEAGHGSEHTVFVMPPDPSGMTEGAYT